MKIVVVSEWFSASMGYAENYLPKAFGQLGHDVHLLTSDLQVYATSPDYDRIYRSKLGDKQVPQGVFACNGFTLHRMQGSAGRLGIQIPQLSIVLARLKPDLVYCFEIDCPTTVQVARQRRKLGYKILCESRLHASIFRPPVGRMRKLKWRLRNWVLGTADVIKNVDRFYPLGPDVLSIITTYFGVPKDRTALSSLAVETQIFSLARTPEMVRQFREKLDFRASDLICVYTGRFTPEKGPLILAKAIDALQSRGHSHVRGLFVGQGEEHYVKQIAACAGCVTHPFVMPRELAGIYHASDIGVWPEQESTSQLDAMACGLPVILNDSVQDPVRLGESSLTFKRGDVEHLATRIIELLDADKRRSMGIKAAQKMLEECSWNALAGRRLEDFSALTATSGAVTRRGVGR